MSTLRYGKFKPIYRTQLIAVEVQCIYTNYAVRGGGSGGLEDDFFPVAVGNPSGRGNFFWGGMDSAM